MTWTTDLDLTSGTYEITVIGALGPVLRAAMQPLLTTASGPCTTLRTALGRRGDLTDLVAALEAKGFEVTHAALRSRPDRPSGRRTAPFRHRSATGPLTPAG